MEYCQMCRVQAPTMYVEFHHNIGALVMRFHYATRAYLCKDCIQRAFWRHMALDLTLGWWGIVSFVMTPIFAVMNVVQYSKTRSLPPVPAGAARVPLGVPLAAQTAMPLPQDAMARIQPYHSWIVQWLQAGHPASAIAADIAPRAGVAPAQVMQYMAGMGVPVGR